MDAFELLRREHQLIRSMLDVLAAMCDHGAVGQTVPEQDLGAALDFLKTFVYRCHQEKEEAILFAAMEGTDAARPGGPIGPLLAEHKLSRDLAKRMARQAARCARDDRAAWRRLKENARLYADLTDKHFRTEEESLFPLIRNRLDAAAQTQLSQAMERFVLERPALGDSRLFQDLLESLRRRYPPQRSDYTGR